MTVPLTMPRLGETVTEGTIIKWLKNEGDFVKQDEYIVEVSTAKVETEIPSPVTGTLDKILAKEDQTVEVGADLATIDEISAQASQPKPSEPVKEVAVGEKESAIKSVQAVPGVGFISPLVRKLAREHRIDLSKIKGTGQQGRITGDDLDAYIRARETTPARVHAHETAGVAVTTPLAGYPNERIEQIDHLRREIAANIIRSRQTSAHVTAIVEVDMSNILRQRIEVKEAFKKREGFSLTYLPFVAKAAIDALLFFPILNARIVDEHSMAFHDYVNLGIAVAVENGLVVPVVKHAEEISLLGLAHIIRNLAGKAHSKSLSPDDLIGSTFSITNPGSFGSIIQTPIINQPNVAILSLELVQKRPVIVDEAIAIRDMVFMPLSYDHRLIDGALAAQFLTRIKQNLEKWDFSNELASLTVKEVENRSL